MALPALAGGLLPERDSADAARLLTLRHLGIAAALAILAPVLSHDLDAERFARASVASRWCSMRRWTRCKAPARPGAAGGVESRDPRGGLREAVAAHRADVSEDGAPRMTAWAAGPTRR